MLSLGRTRNEVAAVELVELVELGVLPLMVVKEGPRRHHPYHHPRPLERQWRRHQSEDLVTV